MKPRKNELLSSLSVVSSMGVSVALAIATGVWIGLTLDNWFSTKPWFFYIFMAIGIAAGFKNIYVIARKELDKNDRLDK
jgi:F0F1-type ATP synthase assembly protein I